MKLTKTVGVLLALLVVATGAAAALPGHAPMDAPAEQANGNDHAADSHAADDGSSANVSENPQPIPDRGPHVDKRGPPVDLPPQVPDFVGEIHDLIRQHLSGEVDGDLGDLIGDVTPDDAGDDGGSTGDGATVSPTPAQNATA